MGMLPLWILLLGLLPSAVMLLYAMLLSCAFLLLVQLGAVLLLSLPLSVLLCDTSGTNVLGNLGFRSIDVDVASFILTPGSNAGLMAVITAANVIDSVILTPKGMQDWCECSFGSVLGPCTGVDP